MFVFLPCCPMLSMWPSGGRGTLVSCSVFQVRLLESVLWLWWVVPADAIEPIDKNDSSGSATGCTVEVAAGASGCDDLVAAHGPSHLSPATGGYVGGFLRRPRSSTRWRRRRRRFKV